MGRSVSVPPDAEVVTYLDIAYINDEDEYFWLIDNLKDKLMDKYKSLTETDLWIGREDHVILSNDLVYIGVSAYCSIMSLWVVPRGNYPNLEYSWIYHVEPFIKSLGEYKKVGTMSNGVSVYEKR